MKKNVKILLGGGIMAGAAATIFTFFPDYISWGAGVMASISVAYALYVAPWMVRFMHRSPTYFESIEQETAFYTAETRRQYSHTFDIILIASTSATVGVLVDYSLFRYSHSPNLSLIETIGVMGGVISLLSRIHLYTGKFVLSILNFKRGMREKRYRESQISLADTESGETHNTIVSSLELSPHPPAASTDVTLRVPPPLPPRKCSKK